MTAKQLKNSILQMAVQGKLVPQDSNDEPASVLLERIKVEKEQLIKDGKIKKSKPLPPINDDEVPFDLPEGWVWARLDDVGEYRKGPFGSSLTKSMFVPKSKDSVKVYEQKNAIQKNADIGDYYIKREYFESKMRGFEVFSDDIIVSCAGTIGETFVMPKCIEQGIINQALMRMKITPIISTDYFLMYFDYILKQSAQKSSKGSAIKNIPPFEIFKMLIIPLPPLSEQNRIVAKLEELLPLIEEYDKKYDALEKLNKAFPVQLKKSILQAAVQGVLVEQNSNDESAVVLLERIKVEKEQLIKEGKIKRGKPLLEIKEDEVQFELPNGWIWCRLGDILLKLTDGAHHTPQYTVSGVPFLSVKDISNGRINFDNTKFVSAETHDELYKRCNPERGDILLTKVGTTGISVLIDTDIEFSLFVSVALLKYNRELLCDRFIVYLLSSPLVQEQCNENTRGVGNKNWVMRDIANTIVVLPPLSEQERIVTRVDELLGILEVISL